MHMNMNALLFYTAPDTGAIYIPLPRSAWTPALPDDNGRSICSCSFCKGADGYWDTLVIPGQNDKQPYTFTVHMPELQTGNVPKWLTRGAVKRSAR
jgi:hypothetical protein